MLSVHSALGPFREITSIQRKFLVHSTDSGPFSECYVHSAEFWSIRPLNGPTGLKKYFAEWTGIFNQTTSIRRASGPFSQSCHHSRTKTLVCLRPFGGQPRPFGELRPFGAEWTETGSAGYLYLYLYLCLYLYRSTQEKYRRDTGEILERYRRDPGEI